MKNRHSLICLTLLLLGINLFVTNISAGLFSQEISTSEISSSHDAVVISASGTGHVRNSEIPSGITRESKHRRTRPDFSPDTPIPMGALPWQIDTEEMQSVPQIGAGRTGLIPTVWNEKFRLIPTEVDSTITRIQRTGGTQSESSAATPPRHGKALLSVKSAVYSRSRQSRRKPVPEEPSGPGYDAQYFPIVPANSGLGVATYPKRKGVTSETHADTSKNVAPADPKNDPELIRQEMLKGLRTKPYRADVRPPAKPAKKPQETAPQSEPEPAETSKPVKPLQKLEPDVQVKVKPKPKNG